jgi:dihydrofolate reductase
MRRIIMWNRVSADGYFAAADGNLGWMIPDDQLDKEAVSAMDGPGTMLFGRKTYDGFESFWPGVVKDAPTAPDPHTPGRHTPELGAMARWIDDSRKIVFSKSRKNTPWRNSELRHELDPAWIEGLKREPGSDILVFGSGSIVSLLTKHRLIDVYDFVVAPVFLGGGKALIQGLPETARLRLEEAKTYPSGTVKLRYTLPA